MRIRHAPPQVSTPAPRWRQVAAWAAAIGLLLLVLLMYSQPGFMVMLSEMIWACFG